MNRCVSSVTRESGARHLLDRQLAIEHSHDDVSGPRLHRAVHDEHVARVDADLAHGLALGAEEERSGAVADAELVEVEETVNIVVRRRREATGDAVEEQGQGAHAGEVAVEGRDEDGGRAVSPQLS